ncbi:MAG TPA: transketolase, partial [Longimicrobiales bacterium]|nr:transketolase [Longimicrobiales bacterium]
TGTGARPGRASGGTVMVMQQAPADVAALADQARRARQRDVELVHAAGLGHIGGDLSATDILTTLYHGILRVDPSRPDAPDRDRFIMSKGHCSASLYIALASRGFFPMEELATYMMPLSRLNGHPDSRRVPGVETSTGPLGHGLPVAVGAAIAAKQQRASWRVFVLTGDGELQEGSNWEAAMAAAHYGLDNLVVTVDRNMLQQGDRTETTMRLEPLADKWRAFGWSVREVDGHDHAALLEAYRSVPHETGRPSCLIARTLKGRGVSFMQDSVSWHHKVPSQEQVAAAVAELEDAV